ncbi:MAG: hypothetical protein P8020_09120 [Acidobacteriota bacterium]|jgi:hypothetical protein
MNEKPNIVTPALIGGVFLGVTSALPILHYINCACCALVIGGGILASYFYLRDYPPQFPVANYGDAAVLGALTGVFGGIIWAIVALPLSLLELRLGPGMREMEQIRRQLDNPDIPPQVREFIVRLMEGGAFSLGVIVFQLAFDLIISVVFAVIGAIIGFALFQKRPRYTPPAYGPTPPPPPPA